MRAVVLLPDAKITDEQLSQALAYGATTLGLDTDFDGCMRIVAELTAARPVYLLNSKNPVRIEGQKTIGWESDPGPRLGASPTGSWCRSETRGTSRRSARGSASGSTSASSRRGRASPGVQAEAADPFYQSYRTGFSRARHARRPARRRPRRSGSARPSPTRRREREIRFFDGVVARVTEEELLDARALANRHGLAICPNSAVALAGAAKLRRRA